MGVFAPSASSDGLKKVQEEFVNKSYKVNKDVEKNEVIDIVTDYQWILDKKIAGRNSANIDENGKVTIRKSCNVPFCYVVERKSAANAGIANVINMLVGAQTYTEKAAAAIENTGEVFSEALFEKAKENGYNIEKPDNISSLGIGKLAKGLTGIIDNVLTRLTPGAMSELLKKNNLNSDILSPYKYLYITKETGKRYVFPLFNNSATFNSITNGWGEDSPNSSSDNDKVKKIKDFADSVISGVNFLNNLNNFISGKGDNTMTSLETAKCYNLNNSGETITTTFNLYNTTKVDAWKENFKFLFLFIARNLPLRIDIASYVPPYLYDIIVPGIKRLPVSYVSNINITPVGMIRTITCDDFLGTGDKITVNVPEAWTISISFTSLLAQTFNLLLAGSHGGMKVSTDIKTDEGQTA